MTVRKQIIQLINRKKSTNAGVFEGSDLYRDLGFDSLAFVELLVEIEALLHITFEIEEMERCLEAGELIRLAERKTEKNAR